MYAHVRLRTCVYVYAYSLNECLFDQDSRFALRDANEGKEGKEEKEDRDDDRDDVGDEKRGGRVGGGGVGGGRGRGRRLDPREWDGVDMERIGDVLIGWPAVWDDARDDVIQTGMRYDDLFVGDECEAWYRGFWWRCTIHRRAKLPPTTVTIRMMHWPRATIARYRPGLIRKA